MKIAVIVPLLAPEVAKDWTYVQFCLNRTLGSILNNDAAELRIYVICQSRPNAMTEDSRIIYAESKNPIPQDREAQGNDKSLKLAQGMRVASKFDPDYVMFVDADDLVSRQLFEYVVENPCYDAYCIESGYDWHEGSKFLTRICQFHRFCGTSFILRYSEELFPAWLGGRSDVDWICEKSHTSRKEVLADHKFKIYDINAPKVIYVSGGQDQLMDRTKRLRRRLKDAVFGLWRNKKLSAALLYEFSIR